jgi:hypothetical protein
MQTQLPDPKPVSLRLPRLSGWLLITLALAGAVLAIAPQQLPVSLYKLSLVTLAGVVGYWLDRSLFPYARPDVFLELSGIEVDDDGACLPSHIALAPSSTLLHLMGMAMLRRAIIVAATMLAIGLGA